MKRSMKVWVTQFELNETMVSLHYDTPRKSASGWYESKDMGAISRAIARRLFGRLPRHGSAECFCYELTAKRVKGAKR